MGLEVAGAVDEPEAWPVQRLASPWASPVNRAFFKHRCVPCTVQDTDRVGTMDHGDSVLKVFKAGRSGWRKWNRGKWESETTCRIRGPDGATQGSSARAGGSAGGGRWRAGVWLCCQVFPAPRPQHHAIWSSCHRRHLELIKRLAPPPSQETQGYQKGTPSQTVAVGWGVQRGPISQPVPVKTRGGDREAKLFIKL